LGEAIKKLGIPREEIVIATKAYFEIPRSAEEKQNYRSPSITVNRGGLSRKHLFEAVEASLQRLGTSYIDLYQIHRWDEKTPIEETMRALHDLVQSGKVRYIGASTMFAWQFIQAQTVAKVNGWTQFVSMQNLYNLVYREEEREVNRYCAETGVGVIPWSPLAGGYLARLAEEQSIRSQGEKTSPYRQGWFDESTEKIREVVRRIANERKVEPTEVALAWLFRMEGVTAPIIGVSKLSQLDAAIRSVHLQLSDSELDELAKHYQPRKLQGWNPAPVFGRRARL